nr:MAG TPA: Protein of unknown function (DUF4241) [Caudoviricetes sp.]
MNAKNLHYAGNVQFDKEIQVTDPCYPPDSPFSYKLSNALPGLYKVYVEYEIKEVAALIIIHEDEEEIFNRVMMDIETDKIAVDSGQCGFFRAEVYEKVKESLHDNTDFFNACNKAAEDKRKIAIIEEIGVISQSGYGDGLYVLHTQRDENNKVFAAELEFI